MDNYGGRCNEKTRTAKTCTQATHKNLRTGREDKCYYHDKLREGLLDTADDVIIYEDDEL